MAVWRSGGTLCAVAIAGWRYGLDCTVLLWMFGDMVWTALCCYGCLEIWYALHCIAMDAVQSSLDGFVLLQMLRDLVCTALCCYGYKNISFGSSVWILWIALCCYKCWGIWFGMLWAGTDVWIFGLDCFGTIITIYHFVLEDITDLPFTKTVRITTF